MYDEIMSDTSVATDDNIEKTDSIFELINTKVYRVPESGFQEENMVLGRKVELGVASSGNYFSFDFSKGQIKTPEGERVAIINAESLSAVCDAIYKKAGAEICDILYTAGMEWGTREFHIFKDQYEKTVKQLYHLKNMSLADFKSRFNTMISRFGWGIFGIEQKYDFVFVSLINSAYAEMLSAQNPLYNDLFAGFFAGFFSELICVDFDCVEINLNKETYETTYLLADESVTSEVRQRISDGAKYEDIMVIVRKGEFRRRKRKAADVKESSVKAEDDSR